MIFQPVLNIFLLVLLCAPVAALAVLALVKAKGRGRALWAMRLVLLLACFVLFLRPGIPGGATQTLATDTDIVLVVDTTASIVAEDWTVTSRVSTACAPTCRRSSTSTRVRASP